MLSNTIIEFYTPYQPITFLYKVGVTIRNWLFDRKLLPSEQFSIPVICVGNLTVGGTGKTPLVEYLIRLLDDKYRIAVLSRGYKRKTSGYVLADSTSAASDIGDEPCQIKFKFPQVIIAVDTNRRRAMRHLLSMPKDVRPQVVLLDDGFQHRYIQPSFSIVITAYDRLFFDDKLLPVGRLREPVESIRRADMVVVSKCPAVFPWPVIAEPIIEKVKNWIPLQSIFFTSIVYQPLESVFPQSSRSRKLENIKKNDDILLITGIANPTPLIIHIKAYSDKVSVITFDDHHTFTKKDIQTIQTELSKMKSKNPLIICTEKDAARIRHNPLFPDEWKSQMYYLPIRNRFLLENDGKLFDRQIMQHISSMINKFKDLKIQ